MVGSRWESSNRPLFIRTVWKDGHHHVVLREDEEVSAQTSRSARRNQASSRKFPPPPVDSSSFKVPSVKLLLASLRTMQNDARPKRCKTEIRDRNYVKSAMTVDITPSDSVRYNDLNKQVSFKNEKRPLRFVAKSNSVDVHHFYGDDSNILTPPPFSYDNYCVDQFNTSLSERVMIWLDLAIQNQKEFKNVDFKRRVVTAQACPIVERTRTEKNTVPIPNKTCDQKIDESKNDAMIMNDVSTTPLVTSRIEFDQLEDGSIDDKRATLRTTTARRQLHIFLPNLPKKCSDSGSFISSKSSSLLLKSNTDKM